MDGVATVTLDHIGEPTTRIRVAEYPASSTMLGGDGEAQPSPFPRTIMPEVAEQVVENESPVGMAQSVTGTVIVTRKDGTTENVTAGTPVYVGDIFETDHNGSATLVFIDESSFTVGGSALIVIDAYIFDPNPPAKVSFSWLRSLFLYTSGLVGREPPDEIEVNTPMGSIGIRGDAQKYTDPAAYYERRFALADAGTPMSLIRYFRAPAENFDISLDYLLLDEEATLTVLLNGQVIGEFGYFDMDQNHSGYQNVTIPVNGAAIPGAALRPVELRLSLDGPDGAAVLIDNVTGPGFTNTGFTYGANPWIAQGGGEAHLAGTNVDQFCLSTGQYWGGVAFGWQFGHAHRIVVDDINNNGIHDMAQITSTGGWKVQIGWGNGNGHMNLASEMPFDLPAYDTSPEYYTQNEDDLRLALHDVTGNGKLDLLMSMPSSYNEFDMPRGDGGLFLAPGNGDGTFQPWQLVFGGLEDEGVSDFAIADVTNNGYADIVLIDGPLVLAGTGGGGFELLPFEWEDMFICCDGFLEAADLNNDGNIDLIFVPKDGQFVRIGYGNGDGTFEQGPLVNLQSHQPYHTGLVVADFNGDGYPDFAVSRSQGSQGHVSVVLNNGSGGFLSPTHYLPSWQSDPLHYPIVAGDINGNGHFDIVTPVPNPDSWGSLRFLINNGVGAFTLSQTGVDSQSSAIALIDATRTGTQDIVHNGQDVLRIALNGCDPVDPTPQCDDADLNCDGVVDVSDLLMLLANWGPCADCGDCPADINNDCAVDVSDLLILLANWG